MRAKVSARIKAVFGSAIAGWFKSENGETPVGGSGGGGGVVGRRGSLSSRETRRESPTEDSQSIDILKDGASVNQGTGVLREIACGEGASFPCYLGFRGDGGKRRLGVFRREAVI